MNSCQTKQDKLAKVIKQEKKAQTEKNEKNHQVIRKAGKTRFENLLIISRKNGNHKI
ncbi:hypothetical protein JW756_00610 [Candidatus Woesearchaeota archaeon]|nr:hypothetical protein [Candidatus Woesearchaeota archaeon]